MAVKHRTRNKGIGIFCHSPSLPWTHLLRWWWRQHGWCLHSERWAGHRGWWEHTRTHTHWSETHRGANVRSRFKISSRAKKKSGDEGWRLFGGCKAILVSHDAQVDGRVTVLLDGGQQGGAIAVPDLPRMEVVFWVKQLWWSRRRNQSVNTILLNNSEAPVQKPVQEVTVGRTQNLVIKWRFHLFWPHFLWTWRRPQGISGPPPLWLQLWPGDQFQRDPCGCP